MYGIQALNDALSGRYVIDREIGAGGMATVYLAQDVRHDRRVAVKVLRPELAAALGTERFLQETRITAKLDHPHRLTLIDSGEAAGSLFYVLPYVRGESLGARLHRETRLSIDDAILIVKQVASALDYAHRQGVVHRDIKPENILMHEGEAVVADFGIALAITSAAGERLTQAGLSLGTPAYMSMEQMTGDASVDGRTDQYALASVLYELLTGDLPYAALTPQSMIAKRATGAVPSARARRPEIPASLDAAIRKGMAPAPEQRFDTVMQFADACAHAGRQLRSDAERCRRRWLCSCWRRSSLRGLCGDDFNASALAYPWYG